MDNTLGFDEIVDSCSDIIESAALVGEALKDGFQITDAGVAFAIFPTISELIRDGKKAVNQLLDLSPEESLAASAAIAARTGHLPGSIVPHVTEAFALLARTHGQVKSVEYLFADWSRWAKSLGKQSAEAA